MLDADRSSKLQSIGTYPFQVEAPGLIPGTDLWPAGVLADACGHDLMALDIGVASPVAQHIGEDCTAPMYAPKK